MSLIRNQVLLTLVIASVAAVALAGFVGYAPNRLVSGKPIALWHAAGGTSSQQERQRSERRTVLRKAFHGASPRI